MQLSRRLGPVACHDPARNGRKELAGTKLVARLLDIIESAPGRSNQHLIDAGAARTEVLESLRAKTRLCSLAAQLHLAFGTSGSFVSRIA
jgi:hypothetical protein